MVMNEIREAVARGWTYPANEKKVMDTDLAEAISVEILKLCANEAARLASVRLQVAKTEAKEPRLGYATTRELLVEIKARIGLDGKLNYRTVDIDEAAQEANREAKAQGIGSNYEQAAADQSE